MSFALRRRAVVASSVRFASTSSPNTPPSTSSTTTPPSKPTKAKTATTRPTPKPKLPLTRQTTRQPSRNEYLAQEKKIQALHAAQKAAESAAAVAMAKAKAAEADRLAKAAAAAPVSSWDVSAESTALRTAKSKKARLAARLAGLADPAGASAESRSRSALATGVSSFGSGARMLVFQRGDAEFGSNALTADTLRYADAVLRKWSRDSLAHSVVLQSDSTETFSIGADMLAWLEIHNGASRPEHATATDIAFEGDNSIAAFLTASSRFAHTLSTTGSPVITLGGGITAGAAAGIFLGGSIRAVADHSLFSLPDVAVGLSPSAGASVWLSRLTNTHIGLYAALTGAPIGAADQLASGIATHWLDRHAFLVNTADSLGSELSALYSRNFERLLLALELFQSDEPRQPPIITRYGALLEQVFAEPTAAAAVKHLRSITDYSVVKWAQRTASLMESHCPLAVNATLRLLRELRDLPLADAIVLENRVARRLAERGNIFQAIRALKIDERKPKWTHASLKAVTAADLDALFAAPASGSNESKAEAELVSWKLTDHVPKTSQTLGPEPFIGTESPRAELQQMVNERIEAMEDLNSALTEFDQASEDDIDKMFKSIEPTREEVRERDQLLPVDRV